MSITKPLIAAALVAALSAACTPRDDVATETTATTPDVTAPTTTPGAMPETTPGMDPATAQADQGEAIGMLMAINEHEIAAAEQAREKNVTGDVLAYAEMMHTDHGQNLEDTRELAESAGINAMETQMVKSQREKSQRELERMAELEGDAYSTAYIDAMVRDHTEALTMIDSRMMPAATDDAVRQHLSDTRKAISSHLDRAQELQQDR